MTFSSKLLILAFIALAFSYAHAGTIENLRGQRYCEILLAQQKDVISEVKVFNTIGLNQCPAALWTKLNPKDIKKQSQAFSVRLNGPRYWTIDGIKNSDFINAAVVSFGGITMRQAGSLKIRWLDFLQAHQPYNTHKVQRQTTWVYQAGKPVYELVAPTGEIYIMQSYSVQKVAQTAADLSKLATQLQLPAGWSFRTRILKKTAYLTTVNGEAIVIQDNFLNTYQQETPGF